MVEEVRLDEVKQDKKPKKSKEKNNIIASLLAELSFREKAATARELFIEAFPDKVVTNKQLAGISKMLSNECQYIISPHLKYLRLFYVKESQIKDIDFSELEEIYILHNAEAVARARLAKKAEKNIAIQDLLKEPLTWNLQELKNAHVKRLELTAKKTC